MVGHIRWCVEFGLKYKNLQFFHLSADWYLGVGFFGGVCGVVVFWKNGSGGLGFRRPTVDY